MAFLQPHLDRFTGIQTANRFNYLPRKDEKYLAAVAADWKIGNRHWISTNVQSGKQTGSTRQNIVTATAGAGATGDALSTTGASTGVGNVGQSFNWTRQHKPKDVANLKYEFRGDDRTINLHGSYSRGALQRKPREDGFFSGIGGGQLPNLVIRMEGFDQVLEERAARITATNRQGDPVDIYDGGNATITSAASNEVYVKSRFSQFGGNASRDFDYRIPLSLKLGVLVSEERRDAVGGVTTVSFTPPGGAAGRIVNNHDLINQEFSDRVSFTDAYGKDFHVRWISPYKLYNLYLEQPDWFPITAAQAVANHTNAVNGSKKIIETIPAAYIRLGAKFVNNRLWVVGGVRWERTEDEGWGPLSDITATYQKDAQGQIIRNAAGVPIPITTDTVARAKLQFVERGARISSSYDDFYPSINSSFELTDKLIVRAAYARRCGRWRPPDGRSIQRRPHSAIRFVRDELDSRCSGLNPFSRNLEASSVDHAWKRDASLTRSLR